MINDVEILSGIKKSKSKYFDLLFDSYYVKLCTYVASIIKNNIIAEDIVQDLFANIWIKRKKNIIQTSLNSYLYRSAYNASLDYLKHLKIENRFQINTSKQSIISFNDSMELMELLETLEESIEQLPCQCKIIFKFSRFENLKYKEIAKKLSISENTVDTQIRRALEKLRVNLKEYITILLIILNYFL